MDQFIAKHADKLQGTLSCFDRVLFRGYLPFFSGYAMAGFLENATDLVFKSRQQLAEFFPRLLEHSTLCFSARDILSFPGRTWHGKFEGEVVTDQFDHALRGRVPGRRVKPRMKRNWIKMYEKAGWILRVQTVINDPEEVRVRRRVRRRGRRRTAWGATQEECGLSRPLSRRRAAEQRAVSQCVGPRRRPHARARGSGHHYHPQEPGGGPHRQGLQSRGPCPILSSSSPS